jgi:SAM-dependent methyltransferase
MKWKIFLGLLLMAFWLPAAYGQEPAFPIPRQSATSKPILKGDAPYVPTDQAVVLEMLDLAEIVPGDVVYDLGCGDGRIVIAAAKKFGVHAVGIDLNPNLIHYSRENAARAGVAYRVQFLEQNFFDTDIRKATVVTLFLSDAANLKLRPKLLKELQPGSRVVSNEFDMGDWVPDRRRRLWNNEIHAWVVPTNVSGAWEWNIGSERYLLNLNQRFQKIKGMVAVGLDTFPIGQAKLVGRSLQFTIEQKVNDRKVRIQFEGKANGHSIHGTIKRQALMVDWHARRNPSTTVSLVK